MYLKVVMKPHEIIKDLETILATTLAATHDKLSHDAEKIYCTTGKKVLETYIQIHIKAHRKMPQTKYPGLTT